MKVIVRTGKTEVEYSAQGNSQYAPLSQYGGDTVKMLYELLDKMSKNAVEMETKRIATEKREWKPEGSAQ